MISKIDFLFYSPEIKETSALDTNDSAHVVRVLRKSKGDVIFVTDGLGTLFKTQIIEDHPKKCKIQIIDEQFYDDSLKRKVHLAICPTKNADRIENLVEKCVEIGIHSIQFILSKNTYPKKVNIERMNKIAVSAMKQSLKLHLPSIQEPIKFEKFISQNHQNVKKFIAHLNQDAVNIVETKMEKEMLILVGPEGDFSKEELESAISAGFQTVFMGDSRLRTETAGVLAVSLLNLLP
jgi:16S rRNA (uracil1498-N3)-methyltransferase